jgi:serine/threonine protein kinase/Tfp pilus assembly protein PilF
MTASRWQQVKSIFHSAVELDPEALAVFIRESCGNDQELQREVESLLASDNKGDSILENPLMQAGAIAAAAPAHRPDPMVGRIVGNYLLTGELARGGMGIVYRARHLTLPRDVVVKCIRQFSGEAPAELRARFRREAFIQSQLDHPHIVRVYEFFEGDEDHFLVMECVHGSTLRSLLDERRVLAIDEATRVAIQVLEGLHHAHNFHFVDEAGNAGTGVIHRDIKPANILLDKHGNVKLTDFGIAKLPGTNQFTKTGSNPGTIDYMSPEQILNKPVDARSDLYSVGVTLYEMLGGSVPFRTTEHDSAYDVLKAHIETNPPPLQSLNPDVPSFLANAVARSLKKEPDQRWQSAAEFRDALSLYQRDHAAIAVPLRKQPPKRRARWLITACLAALALVAATGILWLRHGGQRLRISQGEASIAILPFADMSPDKNQEYFSDGLAEELLNGLANTPGLRVAGRTSSFSLKGQAGDFLAIGERLHVATILEGSVRRQGNRAKITVHLIRASDGISMWSETFDREMNDVFAVEEEISHAVTATLKVALLREKRAIPSMRTNAAAYSAYLQGQYFLERYTRANGEKAASYFDQAIKLDRGYAPAWVGLGEAHIWQANEGDAPVEEGFGKAQVEVERALALNADLGEAHSAMGEIKFFHDWEWTAADASFHRALALEPGNAQVMIYAGMAARALGRLDEAIALNRRAIEIDPLRSEGYQTFAWVLFYAGRPEEAAAVLNKALELSPEMPNAHRLLGQIYLAQSRPQEAWAEMEKEKDPAYRLYGLALANQALGHKQESNANLAELIARYQATSAYQIAEVYAIRREADQAFQWLERAYAERDAAITWMMGGDPLLKSLERDRRYAALLRKIRR